MRVSLALVCLVLGCGGGGGGGGGAGFTAMVNGVAFVAEPVGVTARGGGGPGGIVVTGSQTAGSLVTSLTLNLHAITGPGTYALGVGLDIFGGTGSVGESPPGTGASNHWATALDGRGGQITITTLSATRLVATFQYTAVADEKTPGATGTRTVTDGKIDLPLTGAVPAVPDNVGAKVSATLDGKPFNAWAASGRLQDFMGGPGVAVDCHSSEGSLSLMLVGVTMPAAYPLGKGPPGRTLGACGPGSGINRACWGSADGDTGTITITSLTAARVKGTFSGTLQPKPGSGATAPMTIADGVFDIGIQ